jgi:hypothetical protein
MSDERGRHRGIHLLDLVAVVVGYSLASLLVRAFWPAVNPSSAPELSVIAIAFLWLGMAMSGPVILMGHRRAGGESESDGESASVDVPEPRTWAELAWLIIGFYWIGLTILVVPARLHHTRVLDTAFLGMFPFLAALGLRFFGPKSSGPRAGVPQWTHHAAVGLLVTWPVAWGALILLGKSLP